VIRKHPKGLPKEYEEGFEVLEAEQGAGLDLACHVGVQGLRALDAMLAAPERLGEGTTK
jgi:hypothetical protein